MAYRTPYPCYIEAPIPAMDRGLYIPWVRGQNTMSRGVKIPWVKVRNTMDMGFKIS
jgi:hypothetical protein